MYAGHVNLAVPKLWQFMPNWKYGSTVEFIIFVLTILFLPIDASCSVLSRFFQKGMVPSEKGTFSAVNGPSKGHH